MCSPIAPPGNQSPLRWCAAAPFATPASPAHRRPTPICVGNAPKHIYPARAPQKTPTLERCELRCHNSSWSKRTGGRLVRSVSSNVAWSYCRTVDVGQNSPYPPSHPAVVRTRRLMQTASRPCPMSSAVDRAALARLSPSPAPRRTRRNWTEIRSMQWLHQ